MDSQKMNAKTTVPPPGSKTASPLGTAFKDPLLTGILFAVIVVVMTIMYFYIRNRKRGRAILFVGPVEAGKTSVFAQVAYEKAVDTVTSTGPNIAEYEVPGGTKAPLILKDLPGHERVRAKFWEANKVGVRGIICVIDSAGGSKAIRDAAEALYAVLTDSLVNSVKPNFLVFANKQDLPTSKSGKVLKHQIEREITTLRLTKSAGLQTTGGSSTSKILGKPDRDFEFDHIHPIKVDFVEGSCKAGEVDVKPVLEWLRNTA